MANRARKYAVIFEAPDGLHVADMTVANDSAQQAHRHASRIFRKVKVKEIRHVKGPEEVKAIADEIKKKYPARTPIDEVTEGVPNRILTEPDLVENNDQV